MRRSSIVADFSDGLPDAMNGSGEHFGDESLRQAIARGRARPLSEGIDALLGDVALWQGGLRPHDDISILAVQLAVASLPR